jgi:hypothetical protein
MTPISLVPPRSDILGRNVKKTQSVTAIAKKKRVGDFNVIYLANVMTIKH